MSRISEEAKFPVKAMKGRLYAVPNYFTTGATGAVTLAESYNDAVTITRPGDANTYTLAIPSSLTIVGVNVTHGTALTYGLTIDSEAGTIAIAFSSDFDSSRCDVTVWCTEN